MANPVQHSIMKKILTLLLLLTTGLLFGQSFEGTLVYNLQYQFKISDKLAKMGMTEEKLIARMKQDGSWSDSVKTMYKQGDYITYSNSNPQSWSVYKSEINKLYAFQEGEASDICTVTDASIDLEFQMTGQKPSIVKLDTTAQINGMTCEVVQVKWKTGIYEYWYHPGTLPVDPKLFEKHIYDGWADYLKISKALPIRIVKKVKGLATVTFTLAAQRAGKIDENLFKIPKLVSDKDLNAFKMANTEIMRIKK